MVMIINMREFVGRRSKLALMMMVMMMMMMMMITSMKHVVQLHSGTSYSPSVRFLILSQFSQVPVYIYMYTHTHTHTQIYEGVLISPKPDQEGNKLQRPNSVFIQHTPHEAQYTS